MAFTGAENHDITLDEAAKLTKNYRDAYPGESLGGYFSIAGIKKLLDQPSCIGLRIYYGRSNENQPRFILVGVTADGNDLHGGQLAEFALDCPPFCADDNPLNSGV